MEMRRAIARPFAAGAPAKRDGFPIQITAIGKTAIAALKLDQHEMPWNHFDATQLDPFGALEYRPAPEKLAWPELVGRPHPLTQSPQLFPGLDWRRLWPLLLSKAQSPRPSDRCIAGIGGAEPGIEGVRSIPV